MKQFNSITFFIALLTFCACGQNVVDKGEAITCYFPSHPTFPGGPDSLKEFVNKNLQYPSGLVDIEGKVFVQFVIDEEGRVTETKIVKGLCDQCDKNVVELLEKMPKWFPSKENGKAQKTKMIIPISFSL